MLGFILCGLMIGDAAPNTTQPRATHQEVADLARTYRIQVYNQYRTQRPVYDELISQSFEVLERARKFDQTATEQGEFLTWFEQAIGGSTSAVDSLPVPLTYARSTSNFETVPTAKQVEPTTTTTTNPMTTVPTVDSVPEATPTAEAEVTNPSKFLGAIGNLILGASDEQSPSSPANDTTPTNNATPPDTLPATPPATNHGADQGADAQLDSTEASLEELKQAGKDLEKSFADIEQDAKVGQAEAQAELTKINEELGQLTKLSYDDAKLFLVRITLTGAANDLAGVVAGENTTQSNPTHEVLRKIRRQIAGKSFSGKPSQRRELLEQIDGILNTNAQTQER